MKLASIRRLQAKKRRPSRLPSFFSLSSPTPWGITSAPGASNPQSTPSRPSKRYQTATPNPRGLQLKKYGRPDLVFLPCIGQLKSVISGTIDVNSDAADNDAVATWPLGPMLDCRPSKPPASPTAWLLPMSRRMCVHPDVTSPRRMTQSRFAPR